MATSDRHTCTPCSRRNEWTEAANVCKECNQNFCKICLEYHDKIFGVNNHTMTSVLSQSDSDRAARDTRPPSGQLTCPCHPMEPLTLYCFPHNAVFCRACKITEHRDCIGVENIAQASRSFTKTAELDAKKRDLDVVLSRLNHLQTHRSNDQHRIEKETEITMASIRDYKHHIVELLDQMERDALEQVSNVFSSHHSRITTDLQACSHLIGAIEHLMGMFTSKTAEDECFQMFVFDKTCQGTIDSGLLSAERVEANVGHEVMHFDLNIDLENYLKQSSLIQVPVYTKGLNENEMASYATDQKRVAPSKQVEISERRYVNIAFSQTEPNKCNIQSICQLDDGWFVLVDRENTCVKVFNESLDQVSKTDTGQWPTQACQSGYNEVSVGMEYFTSGAVKKFEFEIHNGVRTLVQKSKLKMKHYCLCMVNQDGEYYVSDLSGKIHCYNQAGNYLKTLFTKGNIIKDLAIGNDNLTLFIADELNGLVIIDKSTGAEIRRVKQPFEKPCGVAADITGGVFVYAYKVKNVFMVDKTGLEISAPLLSFDPEKKKLRSICYDARNSRLLLGYNEGAFIEVVTLLR